MCHSVALCCDLDDTPNGGSIQERRRLRVRAADPGQSDPRPSAASRSGVFAVPVRKRPLWISALRFEFEGCSHPCSKRLVHPGDQSTPLETDPNGKIVAINVERDLDIFGVK